MDGRWNDVGLHLDDSLCSVNHVAIFGYCDGRLQVIARHHDSPNVGFVQDADGRQRLFFQLIAHNQQTNQLRIDFDLFARHLLNVRPREMGTRGLGGQSQDSVALDCVMLEDGEVIGRNCAQGSINLEMLKVDSFIEHKI